MMANTARVAVIAISLGMVVARVLAADPPVTITEDQTSYTLSNKYATAKVNKRTGDLSSLMYKGIETMGYGSGHPAGYWEQQPYGAVDTITIDPKTNGGERGEVSVKGTTGGLGLEIRYAMGRGDSGLYTYAIFSHGTNGGPAQVGESRYGAKLNGQVFDWLSIDAERNRLMITGSDWDRGTELNLKEIRRINTGQFKGEVSHKYDYSAYQFKIPAFGWSSTKQHVGFYLVNPSTEFLSGGATKCELTGHLDDNEGGDPTILDYWRGTHYGGSTCAIDAGEPWSKVVGPILIYVNSGSTPDEMFKDALAQAKKEADAWPYDWVNGVDYPHKNERSTVSGQLVLHDPQSPNLKIGNLLVGLAAPDYTPQGGGRGGRGGAPGGPAPGAATSEEPPAGGAAPPARSGRGGGFGGFGGFGGPRVVEWQNDAKHYEFWVNGDNQGRFTIPKVRPGKYTLHAIADGVLGEYAKTDITVGEGKTIDLGKLEWTPVRYGKQLWDIGIPNRMGSEFFKGDDHWHWGMYLLYAQLFPNDVNYVIGKSDYRKDWYFEQVPHCEDPNNTMEKGDGRGNGRATPWSITFNEPTAPHGKATLRLAICGVSARSIEVTVNGKPAGTVTGLVYNATINRDGIGGSWVEKDVVFDASLMKAGDNVMKLTIPAGGLTSGIIYDYVRLELDENAPAPKSD